MALERDPRKPHYSDQQRREASEWLVILRDTQELVEDTLVAWNRWFSESEGNRNAFKAVERAYHHSALSLAAPLLNNARQDDYDASISVQQWRTRSQPVQTRPRRRNKRIAYAAAAGIATLALGALVFSVLRPTEPVSSGEFSTKIGEHMDLSLADGSRVTLGGHSRLRVDFTAKTRAIRLEAGEAFFTVHKDPHRPFSVKALDGVITAVGTAFNVRATGDRVTVAVTEGAVRIDEPRTPNGSTPTAAEPSRTLQVGAGQQTYFMHEGSRPLALASHITPIRDGDATRWRDGWLVYRNEPLRYVVADLSRYSNLSLNISPALTDEMRFTGAIFKDNVAEWLLALPEIFPVAVHTDGQGMTIAVRPAAPALSKQTTS